MTLQPFYSASANYAVADGKPASMGSTDPHFMNAFGKEAFATTEARWSILLTIYNMTAFVLLWMGFMSFIYMIVSLRTNIVLVLIFLGLLLTFVFLAGAFWQLGNGQMALGNRLVVGGGACGFVTTLFGWYLFASILMASLDFPIMLPGKTFKTLKYTMTALANHVPSRRYLAYHQGQEREVKGVRVDRERW